MISREKIVVWGIAGVAGVGLLYALAAAVAINPIRQRRADESALRRSIGKLTSENTRLKGGLDKYAELRDRTFADTPLGASVQVAQRVNEFARRAGLGQGQYTATTFTSPGKKGYSLVGCNVQGQRVSLSRLTNFLYLLKNDGHLHRVTNLDITPQKDKSVFNFSLRYVSPVLDGKLAVKGISTRKPLTTQQAEILSLNTDQRAAYNVIHERNLFKPYVKPPYVRPPRVRSTPRPRSTPPPKPAPPPPPPPAYDRLVVTGLPGAGERHEVHLTAPGSRRATVHKVGDKIPVGVIAMVDYRELLIPGPDKRKQLSSGRVILKIGRDYWAVERGQPLGGRRLLKPGELPDGLKTRPTSRPARTGRPVVKPRQVHGGRL